LREPLVGLRGESEPGSDLPGWSTPAPPSPGTTCEDLLVDAISGFLDLKYPSLASYASEMEMVGVYDDIDPRLIAAIAVGENGTAKNNPFGLGGNGSARFSSIDAAIQKVGAFLNKLDYRYGETTVAAMWNGNGFKTVPGKPWQVIQYPAYCYGGANGQNTAACQNTGSQIAGFLQTMGGNPTQLSFPCPD
jgi:hypothetical protein